MFQGGDPLRSPLWLGSLGRSVGRGFLISRNKVLDSVALPSALLVSWGTADRGQGGLTNAGRFQLSAFSCGGAVMAGGRTSLPLRPALSRGGGGRPQICARLPLF